MDDRQLQLKALKKAYLKQRRKALRGWNFLWFVCLFLLALSVGLLAYMVFYKTTPIRLLDIYVWTPIKHLIGIKKNLLFVGVFVLKYAKWFILGFGVLFLFVWIFRACAIGKTKRFDSYLDYMTLKNTLKTERQEAKVK